MVHLQLSPEALVALAEGKQLAAELPGRSADLLRFIAVHKSRTPPIPPEYRDGYGIIDFEVPRMHIEEEYDVDSSDMLNCTHYWLKSVDEVQRVLKTLTPDLSAFQLGVNTRCPV